MSRVDIPCSNPLAEPNRLVRGLLTALFLFAPIGAARTTGAIFGAITPTLDAASGGRGRAMLGWLVYSAACWIVVAIIWRWSRRRGTLAQIFAFHRPAPIDFALAVAGFAVGVVIIYPTTQWVAHWFGTGMMGMHFDLHRPAVAIAVVIWAVVTAPLCEEILFRGLAVEYLRAQHAPFWLIVLLPCVAFAAIHLPYFGLGGAMFILPWSLTVMAIRLWRDSLTPGWILHVLNNIFAYLVVPLLSWPSSG
jgi:membrane protease YdiL (CAAX protease family)